MLEQRKQLQPICSRVWNVTHVIVSVLYRIANRKRYMDAHHDSLKLCSDRDLAIRLLRKRHELRRALWGDVGDRVLEQATDALNEPEDYGRGDNLSLEYLFAEMTEEELGQSTQTQEIYSGDESITGVPNDDDHELFEDYMEIDDT